MSSSEGFGKRKGHNTSRATKPTAAAPTSDLAARSPVLTKLLAGLALAVGIAGGTFASRQLFAWHHASQSEAFVDDIERKAVAAYPGLTKSEAMSRYAQEHAPAFIASSKSDQQRRANVAAMFFGFYHVNTRARVDFCNRVGVDISEFTQQFMGYHRREYERALAIAADLGLTEEKAYSMSASMLARAVTTDMQSIQQKLGVSDKGACTAMNERADQILDKLHFSTIQPEAHRHLMGL